MSKLHEIENYDFFKQNLPFSKKCCDENIKEIAHDLLKTLNLSVGVKLIKGLPIEGLLLERQFRINWWDFGLDLYYYSLFKSWQSINKVGEIYKSEILTLSWVKAMKIINSSSWRTQFYKMTNNKTKSLSYYRLFFRLSSQNLIRTFRWHVQNNNPNFSPYIHLTKLYTLGILPIGIYKDSLLLFKLGNGENLDISFSNSKSSAIETKKNITIFLSYAFENTHKVEIIKDFLLSKGYEVFSGVVDDNIIPPETILADRILKSNFVFCFIDKYDEDYGFPTWIRQELEYATEKDIPVFLLSSIDFCEENISYTKIKCSNPFSLKNISKILKDNVL
ncbi:MAG: toll/interleukin-1 receptor domain-containing protein [Candidatus Woesearchaeota archaeon]